MNKTLNFPTTNISPVRSSDSLLSPNEEGLISLAAHYFVTGAKNNNTQLIEKKLMTNMGQLTSLGIYAGKLKLSKGHICLSDNLEFEYFKRGGDIIRAECDAPVMPDGYRCGRYFHRDSYYQNNMEMIDEKMNAGHA